MATVSVEDVRDTLHIIDSDIPDVQVLKMIKRATVALALELSKNIDYIECSEAEKEAITLLAAIYAVCYLTGGSAVGLNFRVGDLSVDERDSNLPSLDVLRGECERLIDNLKTSYVGSA